MKFEIAIDVRGKLQDVGYNDHGSRRKKPRNVSRAVCEAREMVCSVYRWLMPDSGIQGRTDNENWTGSVVQAADTAASRGRRWYNRSCDGPMYGMQQSMAAVEPAFRVSLSSDTTKHFTPDKRIMSFNIAPGTHNAMLWLRPLSLSAPA